MKRHIYDALSTIQLDEILRDKVGMQMEVAHLQVVTQVKEQVVGMVSDAESKGSDG